MPRARAIHHDLERAIPYLLARTGARLGNAFAQALKPHGLSLAEWRVCASLNHQPGQTLSQLVANASMDMSALSRLIDRLITRGYVARQRSAEDARALRLTLTAAGTELTRSLIPAAKQYEAVALQGFSEAEVDRLRDMLHRIHANASDHGRDP
jgi:DNA-binding MarR family transcriptional regulator